ncbi:hypothetical protein PVMG_03961 [Plasmodium vivax Mauritania I]|uniref:Uncharacterized protein n=1 Tax=Plasmodium vivax Mauritania I TaxID=1035515 RepID=A0A0J9TMC5_PLAVI|nr:hypothetical protein PVMG_03961 [Plasmodium vivax Mauritania I]
METGQLKLFLFSLLVCLFAALTFYKRFRYTFYRNYEEQKLSLYSEESFYFSFFDDIVKSETYLEGLKLLLRDDRSEYPNTINAIRRFNIYPEVVLGTVWRVFNLKESFLTPFNFYVYAGRSYISGAIFLMLFFSCYREKFIMRLSAFPLRENFASVYMWCNILLIYAILRERKFSVFVTLTHVVALFGLDLLGFDIQKELRSILLTFSCSYVASLVATFFPRYLMCTYLPFVLAAIITTNAIYRRGGGSTSGGRGKPAPNQRDGAPCTLPLQFPHFRSRVMFVLKKGVTSIVIFLLLRLTTLGMEKDDSHVLSLLKVRLHLGSHNFDSMIYSVGSEFNPFTRHMFGMIRETSLFDYFVFFSVILLICAANWVAGGDHLEAFEAHFLYVVIQFICFALLALMISRLRVLALPLMCLLSSLVGSPHLLGDVYRVTRQNLRLGPGKKALSRLVIQAICLLECAYPFAKYFPTYEYLNLAGDDPVNIQKNLDLVVWLRQNLKEGEPIITDIPTSSFLRSTTNFKMVLNPHYENVAMRRRVQDYYMFSSCLPFSDAKRYYYDRYKVRYFVANIYRCASTSSQVTNAFNVAEFVGSNYARCRHKTSMKFCQRVLYDDRNYKTLYRNGKFSVIYFDPIDVRDDSPYERFDEGKYADVKFYIPWLARCMQTDSKCQEHVVDVARSHLDILRYSKIGFALYQFVERTFLSGQTSDSFGGADLLPVGSHPPEEAPHGGHNLHTIFHLAEFYDYDVLDKRKAGELYRRAIQLIAREERAKRAQRVDQADQADQTDGADRADHPPLTVPPLVPFVPIAKRMQMLTSYIYFLLDTAPSAGRADILNLYENLHLLVLVAGSALDDGFYYEGGEAVGWGDPSIRGSPPADPPQASQTIRRTFNAGDLDQVVTLLCENAVYLYRIKGENPRYVSIYKKMWRLVLRVSHMDECVLRNYHLLEGRRLGLLDYLAFFYLYR